jgi:hypothetical protein
MAQLPAANNVQPIGGHAFSNPDSVCSAEVLFNTQPDTAIRREVRLANTRSEKLKTDKRKSRLYG